MTAARLCCLLFAIRGLTAFGQEIRIYSEFQRFDPYGNIVAPDRGLSPREILSPAMARNGHMSVQVVVSGPAGTNYLLYAQSNHPEVLSLTLYREYFAQCGSDFCPDYVTEQRTPAFGAIPESLTDFPGQTTRCYLLDIKATANTPPRYVRVEMQMKIGTWLVAPIEIRIMAPTVPDANLPHEEFIAPLDAPASQTALLQMTRYLAGQQPVLPSGLLRVRDFTQRNAAEDMLLARSMGPKFPAIDFLAWNPAVWPGWGAEWYLRVRDFLYNLPQ